MFMRIKYVCICRFCLLFAKINHGVFSPPSVARNKKPRFSEKYQQLKKESVNAEIQKLLDADAQILELKRQLAAETVKIDALGRKLHNKQEVVRERKRKVCSINFVYVVATVRYIGGGAIRLQFC